jgi:hypothetical protein
MLNIILPHIIFNMKKIMSIVLVGLLAFTGCKKETTNINEERYSLNDFTDTRAAEAGVVYKNEIGPSNLRAIVRKVANSDNQYRLILKVDSVYTEAGKNAEGVPQFKMIALDMFEQTAIVTSGLSITDPLNPDKEVCFLMMAKCNLPKCRKMDSMFTKVNHLHQA